MMDRARVTLARLIVLSMLATTASLGVVSSAAHAQEARAEWAIAVHGGAGTARPEDVGSDRERQFREKLTEALSAGGDILARSGCRGSGDPDHGGFAALQRRKGSRLQPRRA
jgi:hypothetical protein